MRILIIGAGAIGGVTGGYLTHAGADVLLVDRVAAHVTAMRKNGLLIDGAPGELRVPVQAAMPEEVSGIFDIIFLTVKSQHTREALALIPPHLAPDGMVVSLQNGLANKPIIASTIGEDRTVGAMIRLGCGYNGPGHVTHLTRGVIIVGELDGRMTARLEVLRELLAHVAPAESTPNLYGWLWAKETYGCLLGVTATVDATIGEALALPGGETAAIRAMEECVAVAHALGIRLEAFDFLDPNALLADGPRDRARTLRDLATITERFGHTKSGIWRDIVVRRIPTEVAYTHGEVARQGGRVGIPTPVITRTVEMTGAIERGERPMSPGNLRELAALPWPSATAV